MPPPVLTTEQQDVLNKQFLPAYLQCSSHASKNSHLKTAVREVLEHEAFKNKLDLTVKSEADWLKTAVREVLEHEAFKNKLDLTVKSEADWLKTASEADWSKSIKHWFTNRRDKQNKHATRTMTQCNSSNDSNDNSSNSSNSNSDSNPNARSSQLHNKVACVKTMHHFVSLFQIIRNGKINDGKAKAVRELWGALDNQEKASFEQQARATWDIKANQDEFMVGVVALMDALCQYGHLGKLELMLSYNFVQDGSLVSGSISAHSDPETIPDFEKEKYCPVPESSNTTTVEIPRDSESCPRFPDINLNVVSPQLVRELLSTYFGALWTFNGYSRNPNYRELQQTPDVYIDTTVHEALPVLHDPLDKSLKTPLVLATAEWFLDHSTVSASQPFEFKSCSTPSSLRPNADTSAQLNLEVHTSAQTSEELPKVTSSSPADHVEESEDQVAAAVPVATPPGKKSGGKNYVYIVNQPSNEELLNNGEPATKRRKTKKGGE
ncbi:hypothetical protein D9758_013989 [Tetrapyrgos nigripes]|uniref:Uncharacterized protein n=1 Tax=Tetrapyrgos nigripes TaxID=182062 RepID=A0A8H5G7Q7_9AGAR|nr:hypothetical protein D9758_013989 [Tetrapyrgos nigripes]